MNKSNYLSLEQHAERINETDATIRDNIMLKADYIVSAIDELGEDTQRIWQNWLG